jgi:hypothetical protein
VNGGTVLLKNKTKKWYREIERKRVKYMPKKEEKGEKSVCEGNIPRGKIITV